MANWCEGTLKVRGKKEDVIRFLKEGILPATETQSEEMIYENPEPWKFVVTTNCKSPFLVTGTNEGILHTDSIVIIFEKKEDKEEVHVLPFHQDFSISAEQLAKVSKTYNIDFKIWGFERGLEFNQDIEIIKGKIVKNDKISFNDYKWECINPKIGG